MADPGDQELMRLALEEATVASYWGDVPIGAIVARGDEVLSRAGNARERRQDPTAHAEVLALRAASDRLATWRLEGCTMYVTLEPCAMCAGALMLARVDRLVIGAMDECWRILRPGGRLTIRGPRPDSENLWVDVSHRRAFVEHSFDHFDWSTEFGRRYRYGVGPWLIVNVRREFGNFIFALIKREAE